MFSVLTAFKMSMNGRSDKDIRNLTKRKAVTFNMKLDLIRRHENGAPSCIYIGPSSFDCWHKVTKQALFVD
jgi:hypothetical protein